MCIKGAKWPGWDFLCHKEELGENFEGNLYLCLTPAPSKSSWVLIFGHKMWLSAGDAGGDEEKWVELLSSLISCLCFSSVMLFHLLHSDSRCYMEDNLCLTSIFLSRDLFEDLQNQIFLKNIQTNLGVVLTTNRLWAISGYCLLDRTINSVHDEKHTN